MPQGPHNVNHIPLQQAIPQDSIWKKIEKKVIDFNLPHMTKIKLY